MLKRICFFVVICFIPFALGATDTLSIPENHYVIDHELNLVLTNVDVGMINDSLIDKVSHVVLDQLWEVTSPLDSLEVGKGYQVNLPSQSSHYILYFTELPIIQINTDSQIEDEKDVHAFFTMIESDGEIIASHIGIQYRGGWSQTLPKKSMEIEFWTDQEETNTRDLSILGMREDDDWNLQAMYNEPLRIRSKTNFDLWGKINTLHYQEIEPKAKNSIKMEYAEVFVNDEYQGLYCIGEKIDPKQLKLKSFNGAIRGELYKGYSWGVTTFGSLPDYDNLSEQWGGFEYKHPNEHIEWSNLYELANFIINSNDTLFFQEFGDRFEIDNLVDYFIFLNLLRATDNTGKNIYIAKYDADDKYFYVPWDLDGTWGIMWRGDNENVTDDILVNGFYDRLFREPCLEEGFREHLKTKWLELRESTLSDTTLIKMFDENHTLLVRNAVYAREALAWPEYNYDSASYQYLKDWLLPRTTYLDLEFGGECAVISHTSEIDEIHNKFKIYPNPTEDLITIKTGSDRSWKCTIYNQIGQRVLSHKTHHAEATFSFGHFNKGIYMVILESKDQVESKRIIVR